MTIKDPFLKQLSKKIIIQDGAMGTSVQALNLTPDDFHGLDGCNEYLCISRPDVIKKIHEDYLKAGADITKTNSFGTASVVLAEYDIADRAYEISKKSAELAKQVANGFSTNGWPRFVAGVVGPTTKLLTLGHIDFDTMHASYVQAMCGLLDGGADLLQIETCQDLLQIKCAVIAAKDAIKKSGREVPICVTFTVETVGTLLVGSEISAVLTVLESLPVDIIGMNCATGPDLMQENIKFLCNSSSRPVAVVPNAGLPRNEGGCAVYDLSPKELADYHEIFVKDYGVSLVGGCCGTHAGHINELYKRLGNCEPKKRTPSFQAHLSSTYLAVTIDQDGTSPLIVGERCNANGSKVFKEALLNEDWDKVVELGKEEVAEGSHVIDVCTAYVGRDEVRDMTEVLTRYATSVTAPIMIDSTQLDVLEKSLKLLGGRCIVNSINLEDGEGKFDAICRLLVRYGAAVVALTIDEDGMAKTAQKKLEVAQRMFDLATKRHGVPADAIIFDPLTFTIGSGDEDSRKAGLETLEGIKLIKQQIPHSRTILGLSNISFGLKPYPRQILNSVYLAEAIKMGLDSCIVNAKKILPTHKIPEDLLKITMDLIYDNRSEGYDPLFAFIDRLQTETKQEVSSVSEDTLPIEEVLKKRIIDGKKVGIEQQLDRALEKYKPLEIINTFLLDGMKVVGDLFGSGQMQLPFVLQSAETMKKAVGHLQNFMDKDEGPAKGCLVIGTVKGDVHDIGKNLVDIILSNNGYSVVNLGIKQPIEAFLEANEKYKPNALGMSGLLVKSTWVMKENLQTMTEKGLNVPVICGGAALNKAYVDFDLRETYKTGSVFYGADAFTGLQLMNELTGNAEPQLIIEKSEEFKHRGEIRAEREVRIAEKAKEYVPSPIKPAEIIPVPPFWGSKVITTEELDLNTIFKFINKKALYANQWQYRKGAKKTSEYFEFLEKEVDPILAKWCKIVSDNKWLHPKLVYGYYPCNSEKNALHIYDPEDHDKLVSTIEFPRQTTDKRWCLADYFLPKTESKGGEKDVVAFHVVTAGEYASQKCQELFKANEYNDYLHYYGLSVETAEALAEYWHSVIRKELNIHHEDAPKVEDLFKQRYHGERYSFGYPACPNLEDQKYIFDLLKPERIGVSLSEEFQLHPEQSTSAIIVHNKEAAYFSI